MLELVEHDEVGPDGRRSDAGQSVDARELRGQALTARRRPRRGGNTQFATHFASSGG